VQVLPFGVVEMQSTGDRLQHRLRRARQIAALQSGVVVDADPGEHCDFLAPQTLHPPPLTMGGQPGLLGGEPGPAAGQEVLDVPSAIHGLDARTNPAGETGPVSTRIAGPSTCLPWLLDWLHGRHRTSHGRSQEITAVADRVDLQGGRYPADMQKWINR
jgi:hypothetical protein